MKKSANFYENIFLAFLFAIGAAIFHGSSNLRAAMAEPLNPGDYGKMVSGTLCILCILRLLWINLLGVVLAPKQAAAYAADTREHAFEIREKKLIVCQVLLMIFYAFGITRVGYFTSTYIYSFISILLLSGQRTWKSTALYAAGLVAFCYVLYLCFTAFQVMLPNTPLI